MSSLIIPGQPQTALDRAVKAASLKMEAQFQERLKEKLAVEEARHQQALDNFRQMADIGHAAINALRSKGVNVSHYPAPGSGVDKLAAKYIAMGKDFDTLMTAVKADVMLTSEWERFAMMLRMAQED